MWECGDCGEIGDDFHPCWTCGSSKDRASRTGLSLEDVLSTPSVKPGNVPLKGSEPQKADLPTVNNEQDDKKKSTDADALEWIIGLVLAAVVLYGLYAMITGPPQPDDYAPTGGLRTGRDW